MLFSLSLALILFKISQHSCVFNNITILKFYDHMAQSNIYLPYDDVRWNSDDKKMDEFDRLENKYSFLSNLPKNENNFKIISNRQKRKSLPFISTFDISRMFQKKKVKSKENSTDLHPSVSSLRADMLTNNQLLFTTKDTTESPNMTLTLKPTTNEIEIQKPTKKPRVRTRPTRSTVKATITSNQKDKPKPKALQIKETRRKSQEAKQMPQKAKAGRIKPTMISRETKPLRPPLEAKALIIPQEAKTSRISQKVRKPQEAKPPLIPQEDINTKISDDAKTLRVFEETKTAKKPQDANSSRIPKEIKPLGIQKTKKPNKQWKENLLRSPIVNKREPRVVTKKKADNDTLWPVKHSAVVEGDIVLGGLMMVHSRSEGATCGPVMAQGGVQALEAMLFALDAAATLAPPKVTIGAHVLDDCDNDTYGLEMALDFIKGSISNIDDAEYACNATAVRKVISGVVGAASSVTSVQVANLLRLFKIPQVSFFSTSPELSNKARFEYFTRTIPSDLHQVRAMVEIVKKFGWKYVSIIYEESNYGIKAFEELETLLARNGICIAVKERLVKDSGEADDRAYDAIVAHLLSRPRARGVIVFGSDQEVAGVMSAVGRARATNTFRWVGSDGWSARALVSEGNEEAVEGTISVQPQANEVRGFKEYFLNLTVENNARNPWFIEFWEDHFRCRYPGSPRTPYNGNYSQTCTGKEKLSMDTMEFEAQLQFVADAVMAFAHAIRDMHMDLCGGRPGLCDDMRPASGSQLLRYLRQVRFTGLTGDEFHFDSNGDGPARYNILHFKQVSRGVYRWMKVGRYLDGELELDMDEVQFKWGESQPPESVCSAECELGQAKQYVEGESCCWHCFNCTQYEIRSPEVETACLECPRGTLPDATRTICASVPEIYLRPDSSWAIGAMTFSSLGILLTTFVVSVWVARGDTPVVRASGKELSFVLLAGIMMCYLCTFALVFRPNNVICSLQRFGTGFCFTVVYAALLTKTNRIARIFDASKHSARRPTLISPKSQLVICTILVSIQVVIVVVWQIVAPARAIHHYPTREDNMLVCDSYVDASYTIAFFYPIVLIIVCTVYAVLTRKIPEAFNESKHIGFTMYTTCVIWLAFVPLYFGTASHVPLRVTSMAVTISLSASVTLVCLFSPKLYIILVRPERNVRANLVPRAGWRGAGAAGGAVCAALVGAAPLPRVPDPTPSTDRSTVLDTDKTTLSDKYIQTDDLVSELPRKPTNGSLHVSIKEENVLALNAEKLIEFNSGLPNFQAKEDEGRRRKMPNGPPGVTIIGPEIPL